MAWTAPMTAVANAVFTAAQFNTHVRDNLLETSPAKATTPGSYFVTDAANSIGERVVGSATIAPGSEGTSSASYVDLATPGPAVTVSTGTSAIVIITAEMQNASASAGAKASCAISGASTVAAADATAIRAESSATAEFNRISGVQHYTGLTAGSNTFTMKYASTSGTCNFNFRHLLVIPL